MSLREGHSSMHFLPGGAGAKGPRGGRAMSAERRLRTDQTQPRRAAASGDRAPRSGGTRAGFPADGEAETNSGGCSGASGSRFGVARGSGLATNPAGGGGRGNLSSDSALLSLPRPEADQPWVSLGAVSLPKAARSRPRSRSCATRPRRTARRSSWPPAPARGRPSPAGSSACVTGGSMGRREGGCHHSGCQRTRR